MWFLYFLLFVEWYSHGGGCVFTAPGVFGASLINTCLQRRGVFPGEMHGLCHGVWSVCLAVAGGLDMIKDLFLTGVQHWGGLHTGCGIVCPDSADKRVSVYVG